jgi:hypothetical protein
MKMRALLSATLAAAVVVVACADTTAPDDFDPGALLMNKSATKGGKGGKDGSTGGGTVTVQLSDAAMGVHPGKNFKESNRQVEISGGPQAPTTFAFAGARTQYEARQCVAARGNPDGPALDKPTADLLAAWLEAADVLAGFHMTYDTRADNNPSDGHDLSFNFFDDQGRGVSVAIFAHGSPPPTIARTDGTFTVSGGVVRVWLRDGPPKNHPKLFCGGHNDQVTLTVAPES